MQKLYEINSFDKGLVTNVDKGDLPPNSSTKFQNLSNSQPGKMTGLAGYKQLASFPSAIQGDGRWFVEVVINDTQAYICWGLDSSSIQHFYYSTDGGTTWIEITEFFETTVNGTPTSDSVFSVTGGNAGNDYYNDFWIFHQTTAGSVNRFSIVRDYVGSGTQVTLWYALDTVSASDKIVLMRFPFWNPDDLDDLVDGTLADFDDHRNMVMDAGNFKPRIVQRLDAISIYTGRKKDNLNPGVNNHSNIWFGWIDTTDVANKIKRGAALSGYGGSGESGTGSGGGGGGTIGTAFFNHDDGGIPAIPFIFTGYHAERKFLDSPHEVNIIGSLTSPAAGAGVEALTAGSYGIKFSLIYDGYQESPLFFDKGAVLDTNQVVVVSTGDVISCAIDFDRLSTRTDMEFHPGSRRIGAIRVYVCEVNATSRRPITPFFFVKQISVFDTGWSVVSNQHRISFTISNKDYQAGQALEAELVHGYFSKIRINADFGENVNGREVIGSLMVGEDGVDTDEGQSYLINTPINLAKRNSPDAPPESDIRDLAEDGIYEIFNISRLNDKPLAFGKNKLLVLAGETLETIRSFEEKGAQWYFSVASNGIKVFWANLNSIYRIREGVEPEEIGFAIKDEWQSLSENNRKKSIAVFDEEQNDFILHSPSGTTYIWDEDTQSFKTYVTTLNSIEWITRGVDGEILATDKTNIYELFPDSGSTENLTGLYEKIIDFGQMVAVRQMRIMYKLTGVITAKVFDMEVGENYAITPDIKFFAQSQFADPPQKVSFKARRIKLQLSIAPTAASNYNYEIDSIKFFGHPLTENL